METKNCKQHFEEVAYHLRNAKSCLRDALSTVQKPENKLQIENNFNLVSGALQDATTILSNYKD
ncbi:hypothetical protein LGK95_07250 [Clostridium algoriphilum]|uniref:hypothetical protein n=1 Tax=Clostridium algoriphilum TaxID=198347 RepID=UPI001CF51030|nr:hypothetical protein [Clostridium algoriphilum]MCB2293315.1 hypothetical protein [Clostridium algoriphilum]